VPVSTLSNEPPELLVPPVPLSRPVELSLTSIPTSRRSSRLPLPSSRLAEASGLHKIHAVQRAISESRVSKTRIDERRAEHRRTRTTSNNPPDATTRALNAETLTDAEIANILEDVTSGTNWGLHGNNDLDALYPDDPTSLKEAFTSEDGEKWRRGCEEEIASIKKLGVFKLVPRSQAAGRKVMKGKWVLHAKRNAEGVVIRHKSRFVVKGYEAILGVDYKKTASPTMHLETFRIIAHIAAVFRWELHQVDIVTAFLRGKLEEGEEVYMEQPEGFVAEGFEDYIWMLFKRLYGLPQASRIWNKTMHEGVVSLGFKRVRCEYCLYYRKAPDGIVLTGIHIDDFFSAISNALEASRFKSQLASLWEISDLGEAKFCVGIAIDRDLVNRHVYLSQTSLIDRILVTFGMTNANAVATPMEAGLVLSKLASTALTPQEELELKSIPYRKLVGLLMYLAIGTRPDIALAVQKLSQFLDSFNLTHWSAAKRVLRYLAGTRKLKLRLGGHVASDILGFSDASYNSCPDTCISTGAYCFSSGDSGMVSWSARKQKTVAQSSCDAEYIAVSEAAREAMWLRMLTAELELPPLRPTPLLCDNQAANALAEDPSFHARAKHIDVKWHYIRECTENGHITVSYVPSRDNVADILTKPLPGPQFLRLRSFLGLCDYPE
jgi:hypothetical protein